MTLHVVKPGMLTTVQDLGRWGYQRYGVIVGGALDADAFRTANLLVGNEEHCAALEMTLVGPTLRFDADALIALCGADMSGTTEQRPLPMNRPVWVRRGTTLTCAAATAGCRTYLAIAGGIDVPVVLGSRSTYLRAALGGLGGRSLKAGDELTVGRQSDQALRTIAALNPSAARPFAATTWSLGPIWSVYAPRRARILAGSELEWFTADGRQRVVTEEFEVSPKSDRMGLRLQGPPLELVQPRELISAGVCAGTLQVPASGQPILLLADCATTGGYPKIAHVVTVDLPLVAQLRPGERLRFQMVSVEDAQRLWHAREQDFARRRQSVSEMLNRDPAP